MVSRRSKENLKQKMKELGIGEDDIEEKFIHSRGRGGQKVNKASTCVYLKHRPTGLEVKCQEERSQAQNRHRAREILVNKIEARMRRVLAEELRRIEKIRRSYRKRSKKEKEKMLRDKKKRSQKKKARSFRPSEDDIRY